MRDMKIRISILMILSIFCFVSTGLFAQGMKQVDGVEYLQLPTEKTVYSTADVFFEKDESAAREAVGFGIGKLTGGSETGKKIEAFAKKVMANEVSKQTTWNLFPDMPLNEGEKKLRVVITYAPDDGARPMMDPMKGNDGKFVFEYRVNASLKVFDESDNVLIDRDFGAICGRGRSKTWPKGGGGATTLVSFGGGDDKKDAKATDDVHPYQKACMEGALEHAERFVYGLYGMKNFNVPMGIVNVKKPKPLKDANEKLLGVMKNKDGAILNASETGKVQSAIKIWEDNVSSVKDKEQWGVYYNLAVAYSWIGDEAKAKENFQKVYEMNKDSFEKVTTKKSSFSKKDIDKLKAYNLAHPFVEYYAKGINAHPDVPKMMAMDVDAYGNAIAINKYISLVTEMPVPMPVMPFERKPGMKKCTGEILKAGQPVAEFKYIIDDKKITGIKLDGKGDGQFKKIKAEIPYSTKESIAYNENGTSYRAKYRLNKDGNVELTTWKLNTNKIPDVFKIDAKLSNFKRYQDYIALSMKTQITGPGFIQEQISGGHDFEYVVDTKDIVEKSSTTVRFQGFNSNKSASYYLTEKFKAAEIDANGYPAKYEVSMEAKNSPLYMFTKTDFKLLEETHDKNSRQRASQAKVEPVILKKIEDKLNSLGVKFTKTDKDEYTFTYTKSYDSTVKTDSNGNWTEITIGDYAIKREIKY